MWTPRGNRLHWHAITGEGELATGEGDSNEDAKIASRGEGELAAGEAEIAAGERGGALAEGAPL